MNSDSDPYRTSLSANEEQNFRKWITDNKIPFDPDEAKPDYDMRGFWQALQAGDPRAKRDEQTFHFPDIWKTPRHKTFSNESIYATPDAPHWEGNKLIDKNGKVIIDETSAQTGTPAPTSISGMGSAFPAQASMMSGTLKEQPSSEGQPARSQSQALSFDEHPVQQDYALLDRWLSTV
jgi:hypothetical protein